MLLKKTIVLMLTMSETNTLASMLRNNAAAIPDKTAVIYKGVHTSFSEHYQRAMRLANSLTGQNCRSGDRIVILAKNCIEYLELYSACELAGFIVVPINFRLTNPEILLVCHNTSPLVCFYTSEYENQINFIKGKADSIREYICIDEENPALDNYQDFLNQGAAKNETYTPAPSDPVCIVHTSGTTGKPKGAVLSQSALHGIASTISADAEIQEDDMGLLMQPLFHVGAKFLQLAHHIKGATIQLELAFEPENAWIILAQEKITTMQLVPTMLDVLLHEFEDGKHPKTALKTIFYSTAPIRESLLRRGLAVFGQVFLQQYGSTEGGQVTTLAKRFHITDGTEKEQKWLTSAGKAAVGVDLRIVDNDGNELLTDESGEIIVKHPDIMQSYWRDDEASAETIVDGYLHMGDIGYLDEEGFLYIVDRKKDMIISGGENIYPREVEAALLQHPAVRETAVIGIPDERWGEAVLAFVVCEMKQEISEEGLIEYCKNQIASYKKPKMVKFLDALPRIATGKVDKVNLRKPYWGENKRKLV
jgi:acyl-CoA synthetase (AMP-forming)/AMP-acid ligase II